jgi:serine/threonine protein kinase
LAAAAHLVVTSPPGALTGRQIGTYDIRSQIGVGGMGEVYRARDRKLGRDVAIKVLPSHVTSDVERLARFEREARTLASLNHPHIGAIYGVEEADGIRALVLELMEGETLAAALAGKPLSLERALMLAVQIAEALDHAHRRGITHRDLKPSNVMLTKTGTKLFDFGLAKWARPVTAPPSTLSPTLTTDPKSLTREGAILGTLSYMAPEQLEGRQADARSDLFAFGVLLYEMVTGRKAFEGPSQASVIAAILTAAAAFERPGARPGAARSRLSRMPGEGSGRPVAERSRSGGRIEVDRRGLRASCGAAVRSIGAGSVARRTPSCGRDARALACSVLANGVAIDTGDADEGQGGHEHLQGIARHHVGGGDRGSVQVGVIDLDADEDQSG